MPVSIAGNDYYVYSVRYLASLIDAPLFALYSVIRDGFVPEPRFSSVVADAVFETVASTIVRKGEVTKARAAFKRVNYFMFADEVLEYVRAFCLASSLHMKRSDPIVYIDLEQRLDRFKQRALLGEITVALDIRAVREIVSAHNWKSARVSSFPWMTNRKTMQSRNTKLMDTSVKMEQAVEEMSNELLKLRKEMDRELEKHRREVKALKDHLYNLRGDIADAAHQLYHIHLEKRRAKNATTVDWTQRACYTIGPQKTLRVLDKRKREIGAKKHKALSECVARIRAASENPTRRFRSCRYIGGSLVRVPKSRSESGDSDN